MKRREGGKKDKKGEKGIISEIDKGRRGEGKEGRGTYGRIDI